MPNVVMANKQDGNAQADLIKANNNTLTSFSNNKIIRIRDYMFYGNTNLQSINLPSVVGIGASAFENAGLTGDLTFEKFLALFRTNCFRACKMSTITFKGGLHRIDTSSFEDCSSLAAVDIGDTGSEIILTIAGKGFYKTPNIAALIVRRTNGVFPLASEFPSNCNLSSGGNIFVPQALVDRYKAATNWAQYADRIVAIEGTQYETHYANGEAIAV